MPTSWLETNGLTRGRSHQGAVRYVVDAPFTLDRALTSTWGQGIGAEIMGRGKFGPQTGPWPDDGWLGWWGDEPPFRTPVFVLTHHERESLEFDNGTVFHFINATAAEALGAAQPPHPLSGDERWRSSERLDPFGASGRWLGSKSALSG